MDSIQITSESTFRNFIKSDVPLDSKDMYERVLKKSRKHSLDRDREVQIKNEENYGEDEDKANL